MPDSSFTFDSDSNTFAINDDGVVVGAFGLPFNSCALATSEGGANPKRARAFVWVPNGNATVNAAIPRGQAIDLQTLGSLPSDARSIAVDVSRTGAWVTGSAGWPFDVNSRAWAWNLGGATSSAGVLANIPAIDLHDEIGNPSEPEPGIAGARSLGLAVRHETAAEEPVFVGGFTHECGELSSLWKGFRLELDGSPDTYPLWGRVNAGYLTTARDLTIHPLATYGDTTMVIGSSRDCFGATLDPCDTPLFPCPQDCFNSHAFGAVWRGPWDDNVEDPDWTLLEIPYLRDRVDEVLPSIELMGLPGSDGFRAEVRVNRANAAGEVAGSGARDHTDTDPPTPGVCRVRAGFWWNSGATEENPTGWNGWDLDREYAASIPLDVVNSRAWGLSQTEPTRGTLLVGGEDNSEDLARAVCWCGYAESWERNWLTNSGTPSAPVPRVRWDESDIIIAEGPPVTSLDSTYGIDPAQWEIESVHDVNRFGHMIVLLRGNSLATIERVYPAVITAASDVNTDFRVDAIDLSLLIGAWGALPSGSTSLDLSFAGASLGQVDAADLAFLLGQWGTPVDLHGAFACASSGLTAMTASAAISEGEAEGAEPDAPIGGYTLEQALQIAGWPSPDAFAVWIAASSPDQITGAVEIIRTLTGQEQP